MTFPAAVWTSDFVTARAWAALMEPRLNHCMTAVSAAILKMNHGPCWLDLRNTSIIYWLKTRRRENLELWIEMWRENRQGQRQSLWFSMARRLFAKIIRFFFFFSFHLSDTHTFFICWSVVVSREAISRPLARTTSGPATVWHRTNTGLLPAHTQPQLSSVQGSSFGCGLECGTSW